MRVLTIVILSSFYIMGFVNKGDFKHIAIEHLYSLNIILAEI